MLLLAVPIPLALLEVMELRAVLNILMGMAAAAGVPVFQVVKVVKVVKPLFQVVLVGRRAEVTVTMVPQLLEKLVVVVVVVVALRLTF
jgi:hypothetical protein